MPLAAGLWLLVTYYMSLDLLLNVGATVLFSLVMFSKYANDEGQ